MLSDHAVQAEMLRRLRLLKVQIYYSSRLPLLVALRNAD